MFKLHTLASVLIAGSLISAPVLAQQGKTFAKVNGQPISQNVFDAFIAEQKSKGAPESAELRNAVREELIRRELLLQEALPAVPFQQSRSLGALILVDTATHKTAGAVLVS